MRKPTYTCVCYASLLFSLSAPPVLAAEDTFYVGASVTDAASDTTKLLSFGFTYHFR